MRSKAAVIWISAVALLLAALLLLSALASGKGYRNLLLAVPSSAAAANLNTEKLEEFSADEFLLTYEIRRPAMARAVNSNHSLTLVGTNQNYAGIMGYALLDGGFFTAAAMDAGNRHIALNETAAYKLFGSVRISGSTLKMNGETWTVTGVIRDNDEENASAYAPATVTGGQAGSVMVLMDDTVTEAYAKNALKSVGVNDSGYDFINLSRSAGAFGERFAVAWKTGLLAVVLLFALGSGGRLLEKLRFYRGRLRDMYFGEMVSRYRADFLRTAGGILLLVAGSVTVLALSLQILATCLAWQELAPVTGELTAGSFGHKLLWLRDYQALGCVLFGICAGLILLGFVIILTGRSRSARDGYGHMEPYPV